MALTKVIGAGLGTLGDGTANDTKIVFDGNAQDYHIGLDDSADTLVIGKGSALGTTTAMSFDANGIITKPLQPAFLANVGTQQNNIATGSNVTVLLNTEIFDQNADYNTSNYTFTAPVTGRYFLAFNLSIAAIDAGASFHQFKIATSNRTHAATYSEAGSTDPSYSIFNYSVITDMDAADTATVQFFQNDGNAQADIRATESTFSGYLVA